MRTLCQSKKNNFAKHAKQNKALVLFLSVCLGVILFSGHPKLVKRALAADSLAGGSTEVVEDFVVSGIFYDEENPRVLINEELFPLNSYCCGGKITGIFSDYIVMEFPYGRKEYVVGDVIRKKKVKAKVQGATPGAAPSVSAASVYVNKLNSVVESFMASHDQHNAALAIRSFSNPDEAAQIRAKARLMLELIGKTKRQLAGLIVPDNCARHYSLTVKLFDIAEDGWQAFSAGKKDEAEVFFGRLSRVSQEITRESVSILAR